MANLKYAWQPPPAGPPDSYNVYEGTAVGNETLLVNVPGSQTSYSHPRAAGTYSAYVTAITGAR